MDTRRGRFVTSGATRGWKGAVRIGRSTETDTLDGSGAGHGATRSIRRRKAATACPATSSPLRSANRGRHSSRAVLRWALTRTDITTQPRSTLEIHHLPRRSVLVKAKRACPIPFSSGVAYSLGWPCSIGPPGGRRILRTSPGARLEADWLVPRSGERTFKETPLAPHATAGFPSRSGEAAGMRPPPSPRGGTMQAVSLPSPPGMPIFGARDRGLSQP